MKVKSSNSPYKKWKSIPIGDCVWTEGFWAEKLMNCEKTMIPYMEELLCGDIGHALNNFKITAGLKEGNHQGMYWHDGDFYKWIEAAVYLYAQNRDENLLSKINQHIAVIAKAQEEDGYLQTQIQLRPEVDRYENRKYHEMYNTGHLLIAATTHYNVTGLHDFLEIAIKHADLLYTLFYPDTKQFGRFGFNQTQIMGLVELYRATGNRRYLELAEKFINRRGQYEVIHHPTTEGYPIGDMVQERIPLREAHEAAGHAVLALYYYAGAADVYAEKGEQELLDALDRLWESVTQRKMYVTGAVGQTHYGASSNRDKIEEGFIDDYMMPNMTAYNETCANLCNAMFSYRMMNIKGEAKYADIVELVMYNSGISGINLEGNKYFYANPLRMVHNSRSYNSHENATETPDREPYLECFCCPPNLVRTIAKLSTWAYSLTKEGVAVNLYGSNRLTTTLINGSEIELVQNTGYPWDGNIELIILECPETKFSIDVRIPAWAESFQIFLNGEVHESNAIPGSYATIHRNWEVGDKIELIFPLTVKLIEGHPRIEEVRNQIAVKRGPIVYCVESPDLPLDTKILDVYLEANASITPSHKEELLGGITVLEVTTLLRESNFTTMYRSVENPTWTKHMTQLVPYYAWSNRGLAEMSVFLPVVWR